MTYLIRLEEVNLPKLTPKSSDLHQKNTTWCKKMQL